jgi:hypothetical protein
MMMNYKKWLNVLALVFLPTAIVAKGKDYFLVEYYMTQKASAVMNDLGSYEVDPMGPNYAYIWRQKGHDQCMGSMSEGPNQLYKCLYEKHIWQQIEKKFKSYALMNLRGTNMNISSSQRSSIVDSLWADASRYFIVQCQTETTKIGNYSVTKPKIVKNNFDPSIVKLDAPESARKACKK